MEMQITKQTLITITLEDGCAIDLVPADGKYNGWTTDLPGGISVECPHGHKYERFPVEDKTL